MKQGLIAAAIGQMRRLALLLLFALTPNFGHAEGLPYWVCTDSDGAPLVQDKPCADAPNAPPAGFVEPGAGEARGDPQSAPATDLTSWPYWRYQLSRALDQTQALIQRGRESPQVQQFIHDPRLWLGFGAFLLLLLVFWLIRGMWRACYDWWDLRRARRAMQGSYEKANAAPAAETPEKPDAESAKVSPALNSPKAGARLNSDRFSPELLAELDHQQFAELCLRLWRMQGLRAAFDPGEKISDYATILMQKPAAPKKPYGVCLCVPRDEEGLGASVVTELLSVMKERHCSYGSIMTAGEFTMEARDQARGKTLELKGAITLMIEIEGLTDRQRRALLDVVVLGIDPPQRQRRTQERVRLDPSL